MEPLYNIKKLEELAEKKTVIHGLHPLVKVLVTLFYIIAVISFNKYDLTGPLPLLVYQVVTVILAEIPAATLVRRALTALPFIAVIGLFNPLFDRSPAIKLPFLVISWGWVSFFSILLKGALTVSAVLLLVATTGISGVAAALRVLGVPRIFILQLLMIYRYTAVLGEEAGRMVRAYSLRSVCRKGIAPAHWGTFAGQLLLRALDRAQRVYQSMCCRGFTGNYEIGRNYRIGAGEILYFAVWVLYIAAARCFNIPESLGSIVTGVGR